MPVTPENRSRYPRNWREISTAIKERAGWRCECLGECGRPPGHLQKGDRRCRGRHGRRTPHHRTRVLLTTAHLDHTPENCAPDNLRAFCQACHLAYDLDHHTANAARTRATKRARLLAAQMNPLFPLEDP